MSVHRGERRPGTCADARARYRIDRTSLTCREVDGRWVLDPGDGGFGFVVAVHDDAVVTFSGRVVPEMTAARLRTASPGELAAATPGRH